MGGMVLKMRSTFYCISCKKGTNDIYATTAKEMYGVTHDYTELADKGFWSIGLYCKNCDRPLYVRKKHLVKAQQAAFRRHNKKKEKTDGKNAS